MRSWKTWALLCLVAVPVSLLAEKIYREKSISVQRIQARSNLKQIGLALHAYHEMYQSFPPAYTAGPDGTPWHSWRVLLLPFLGEGSVYASYHFDEPWNSPHNQELLSERPRVFASPFQTSDDPTLSAYVGIVSRRSMWPGYHAMKIDDVTDGTSNTIHVIEYAETDIGWTEPREVHEQDVLNKLAEFKTTGPTRDFFHVLLADGAVRTLTSQLDPKLLVSLLTPRFQQLSVSQANWPKGLFGDPQLDLAALPLRSPERLSDTEVSPHAWGAIVEGRTTLYCATSQLVWDQLRPAPGQPLDCPVTELTAAMNRLTFPSDALSAHCYQVSSARVGTPEEQEILRSLCQKFPDSEFARNPSQRTTPGVFVLASLEKALPFEDVLDSFDEPLKFGPLARAQPVQSFGRQSFTGEDSLRKVLPQTVTIGDYVSDYDFIVVLQADVPEHDEIIVAKVTPNETLQETWLQVAGRLKQPSDEKLIPHLRALDELQIPVIRCALEAKLHDLAGLSIPTADFPERVIADASEFIRFRLDEYGAELMADTYMVIGEMGEEWEPMQTRKPRRFICDQPFLLAMREQGAAEPYLLLWAGNADLMIPWPSAD
ncbi:DUF1559 domain-containing protein [bacterium]|nr:DUF1559 domain-containing protein [bacterium]